jgi:hypothetical protein
LSSNNNNNKSKDNLGLSTITTDLLYSPRGPKLDYCGCCEGIKSHTPASIETPPSLSSMRYRIGTHGMFKTSMLARLSAEPKLSGLTTREDNDLAIAIIDAWATIADVITFYQERIANEGFLRTATERMSILELARSIGYELSPGVASDTLLSFKLEENNTSVLKSIIEKGTKVQSIPQQDEMPQTFETIERIEARPELNEIKARTSLPHMVDENTNTLYFEGVNTKLSPEDGILVVNKNGGQTSKSFGKILSVKTDEKNDVTIAAIQIIWPPKTFTVTKNVPSTTNAGISTNLSSRIELTGSSSADRQHLFSASRNLPTAENKVMKAVPFLGNELTLAEVASIAAQLNVNDKEVVEDQNKAAKEVSKNSASQVYAFRQKGSIFGHEAPAYEATTTLVNGTGPWSDWDDPYLPIFKRVKIKSENLAPAAAANFEYYNLVSPNEPIIFLDNLYENIIAKNEGGQSDSDNWIVFSKTSRDQIDPGILIFPAQVASTMEETLVEYAVSGKVTGVKLRKLTDDEMNVLAKFRRRNTTVYMECESLQLAEKPDESPVGGDSIELERGIIGLNKGQVVIISGEVVDEGGRPTGKRGTENKKVLEITTKEIFFDEDLDNQYVRDSVRISANIAKATHGETKTEVLGSGDPISLQQSFKLRQKPLTYIKAQTTSGRLSTLEVRVDSVVWKEVDYLFGIGPKDQVYITRHEDDGTTNIIFGDGRRGSRPPVGIENITAKYRIGTGTAGLLKENQLSILMDRPLGVKSVTNPFPTTTSENPEVLDDARINAPLKVLTIDRIVSITDFEYYARCFAGIGKAKATEIWDGAKVIVHLTLASSSGQKIDPLTCENITESIEKFKDPQIKFRLDSFIKKTFSITAKIRINSVMLSEKVILSVRDTILETFSFGKRQFGQPVTLSEVVTLIQNVKGILYVDIDELHIDSSPEELVAKYFIKSKPDLFKLGQDEPEKYLPCSPAHYDEKTKQIIPAEMLIVNPQGVELLAVE